MDRNETAAPPVPFVGVVRPCAADAAFLAQALGQDGQRRGLKARVPVFAHARAAYLSAEWSGADDRRPSPGQLRRDRV